MDLTVLRDLSIAAVALVVIYKVVSMLFAFIKEALGVFKTSLDNNTAALQNLKDWLQAQETRQVERDHDNFLRLHHRFDIIEQRLDEIHDSQTQNRL